MVGWSFLLFLIDVVYLCAHSASANFLYNFRDYRQWDFISKNSYGKFGSSFNHHHIPLLWEPFLEDHFPDIFHRFYQWCGVDVSALWHLSCFNINLRRKSVGYCTFWPLFHIWFYIFRLSELDAGTITGSKWFSL